MRLRSKRTTGRMRTARSFALGEATLVEFDGERRGMRLSEIACSIWRTRRVCIWRNASFSVLAFGAAPLQHVADYEWVTEITQPKRRCRFG
jgi:hypothetical protein